MIGIRSVKALLTFGAVLLLGISLGVLVSTSTQPSSAIGNNEGKAMHAVTDPTRPADTIIRQGEDLHSGGRPSSPVTDRYLGVTFARQAADIVARIEGRLGTVSVRYLDPGATVRPGVPIINLTRSSDVWVRVAIPQSKAVAIGPGTAISFTPDGLHVVIPGVVEHKSPGLSSAAQEVLIEAKLNAPARYSEWVKPGATGVVSLPDTGGLASIKEGVASLPAIPSLPEGRR
jgi:HlyD family secretion protein